MSCSMRIYSGKIQQSWPLLFPFKILVNVTLETDTLFVFRTCAEALRGCSLIRRSLSGVEMAGSVCCPSDPWYLWGSRGAITMMMCFASWSFCSLRNRIKSFVCVWHICLCWSGFSQIHVLIYGRELGDSKSRNSGYSWMCTAPIWG